jgi:hypothetical protein
MMIDSLKSLFIRDLEKVSQEIEAYEAEELLWKRADGINNPAGNLALHLIGNLNTYIGKNLGNTRYVRNRPAEFSDICSKEEILNRLKETSSMLDMTFDSLSDSELNLEYPTQEFGYPMTTGYFLVHLHGHLNYHLGQINYHRRLINNIK